MATTFKNFLSNDLANTRTLLHEAIPITGSISSGTYSDTNIKEYGHGMFQSVYDYPFLSSSANHIFDLTFGYSSNSHQSGAASSQNAKKINLYNQMAQTLNGYSTSGSVKNFKTSWGQEIKDAIFINFARLLSKDEIKKGSFTLNALTGGSPENPTGSLAITDASGASGYRVDSPSGEYGYLYNGDQEVGQLYYQAGIAILSGGTIFDGDGIAMAEGAARATGPFLAPDTVLGTGVAANGVKAPFTVLGASTGSTLNQISDALRNRLDNVSFNNTTELNSTIYFCRVNHNDFNYSSNPTYLSGSKLRVKTMAADAPVSYLTTIGLYSADNELLAVAKLSEPLRKSSDTELTLRVRLDY
jgi:hypothetical protein|tara:strand:+ start:860 stop:1933 length:1074 start_codon:yes stop_codon:yes gene_type:complete